MERAVEQIANTINAGSKLIVCGVGKSGKIGEKVVATMNSLGIYCSFLHPTEALHGDLGMVRPVSPTVFFFFFVFWDLLPLAGYECGANTGTHIDGHRPLYHIFWQNI